MSLKIIAGKYRNRTLKTLPQDNLSIRPLLGRMKKSIFDILKSTIFDCSFLDLFAGVGSCGIEALSLGAREVVFVEKSPISINLIKQNLEMLKIEPQNAKILQCDIIKNLKFISGNFDIIFMGPPYKDDKKRPLALTQPTLKNIAFSNLLNPSGIIISQRHKTEKVDEIERLEIFRVENYGDTTVVFYKLNKDIQ
ncbi:MAG: 16S rRNA (guanine(966)-N(2))-methyltransferase RsmD [Elusimicrobiota bacterium]|nr:16S rRNA (guanine(966)-N(2))-methyltransferase RsmD [Elusimicrobiota bacterium]